MAPVPAIGLGTGRIGQHSGPLSSGWRLEPGTLRAVAPAAPAALRPLTRRIAVAGITLLLLALAWWGLSGAARQFSRSATIGQEVETAVQLACGVLSILVVLTCFWWRPWAPAVRAVWAVALGAAAGLSALVWGPPVPLVGLAFAGGGLAVALGIIWALRRAAASDGDRIGATWE